MLQIIGISLFLLSLVAFDYVYFILPVYAILAEAYACYLDFVRKPVKQAKPTDLKSYTEAELRLHNTDSSAWVAVDSKVYDVTEYVDKHPGGKEFLLLHAGRDCTLSFNSYHPFTEKPRQIIEKFLIGDLTNPEKPQYPKDTGFYKECSQKLKLYFKENDLDPKDPVPGLLRFIPIVMAMCVTYNIAFISLTSSFQAKIVSAITFGVCHALNTMHIMHDASHGAIGHSETWWWSIGRLTLDWISGSSMLAWHNQHIVGHHQYTNVMGADPDLPLKEEGDIRRLLKNQKWDKMYEWQVYYMPLLYGLFAFRSRYYDIFEIFLQETNGPVKVNPISLQNKLRQSATKLFWLFWRVFIPLKYFNQDITTFLVMFILTDVTIGYWLGFNFQVSHVSDQVEFFNAKEELKHEWAIMQVKSSLDYAHKNQFWTFFSGALNYQVVHHLYPGISQYHYPQITPLIMEVAAKYNVKYNVVPGMYDALAGHLRHLKNMGVQKQWVHLE